ncbi:MAG: TetR/AcrR family transcriptional regulator [Clostridia bacterium]|nr:TetR/AcrR family transcriptional regulator [Clostridia bacterium]
MKNKKQLIMNAAMSLIEKNGIAGLTVSDIANEAKIGKGTVYEYFKCKEDIFYEAMEYGLELCVKDLEKKALANHPDHRKAVYNFIDSAVEIIKSQVFLSFSTDSKICGFDKDSFEKLRNTVQKHYVTILGICEKINQIGIEEGATKKPSYPLTHFIFSNMIFSTVMQSVNGTIQIGIDLKPYLYEMTVKLYS